ncbi:hypothetical protein AB0I39_37990 [Kitasatospora purpeofusca]|uniref:hypothetical protein n=1 Tax=Kitasatospora purpeofusca TaxID=67352 RepID=UPI0033F8AF29
MPWTSVSRLPRPALRLALVAAVALGLGGCASGPGDRGAPHLDLDVPSPAVGRVPVPADGRIPELPLDAYVLDPKEHGTLLRSLALLTSRCMAGAGLPMPPPAATGPVPADPGRNDRRYGIVDPAGAAVNGYHPPPQPSQEDPPLSPQQLEALAGTADGGPGPGGAPAIGCHGAAAVRITGTRDYPSTTGEVVQAIDLASFELSRKDDRVASVIRNWSACMARSGHSQSDPLNIVGIASPVASDAEKAIAGADIGCKQETGLVAVWYAVESAYQQELIQKNKKALDDLLGRRADQLRKAQDVLAGR